MAESFHQLVSDNKIVVETYFTKKPLTYSIKAAKTRVSTLSSLVVKYKPEKAILSADDLSRFLSVKNYLNGFV